MNSMWNPWRGLSRLWSSRWSNRMSKKSRRREAALAQQYGSQSNPLGSIYQALLGANLADTTPAKAPKPPALVAGPVVGYRLWPVYTDGREYWLGSIYKQHRWIPGEPAVGRCSQSAFGSVWGASHKEPAPTLQCTCGIHALKSSASLVPDAYEMTYGVLAIVAAGQVALWGKVIEHRLGYRAQYAYPVALWPYRTFAPKPPGFPERSGWLEPLLRVAEMYGITALPTSPEGV